MDVILASLPALQLRSCRFGKLLLVGHQLWYDPVSKEAHGRASVSLQQLLREPELD